MRLLFFRKKTATHLILLFHRNSFSTENNLILNKMIISNFYVYNKVTFVFSDKKSEDCKVEKLHSTDERINHFNDYYRPFELTALKHHYTMIMEHSVRYWNIFVLSHNSFLFNNCTGGVMVSILAQSAVEKGFASWSGQAKDYKRWYLLLLR